MAGLIPITMPEGITIWMIIKWLESIPIIHVGKEDDIDYRITVTKREHPSLLSAVIFPLWAFVTAWAMESPIPYPPVSEFREASVR